VTASSFQSRRTDTLPRRVAYADWIKLSFAKICSDQIVRSPAPTDVNFRSRRAYLITVAIECLQEARLVEVSIRLNAFQRILFNKEGRLQRAIVSPKPYGSPRLIIGTTVVWKLDHL
jgi:hypothetical protein